MNDRLTKYSLVAGLALSLALPAVAHPQYNAPQGSRFAVGDGWEPGNTAQMGEPEPQRGQGRVARAQDTRRGRAARGVTGRSGRRSRGSRSSGPLRRRGDFRGDFRGGFRGDFRGAGRGAVRGGFAGGIAGQNGRPSLAAHALARSDQIGLTDEQRDQITAARRGVREASIKQRAATQIAELELGDLMGAETPDITAIETKLRELAEQRIAGQTAALQLDKAVKETLTDEQIEELGNLARGRGRNRPGRSSGRARQNEDAR